MRLALLFTWAKERGEGLPGKKELVGVGVGLAPEPPAEVPHFQALGFDSQPQLLTPVFWNADPRK